VFGCLIAGIAGSNTAENTDVDVRLLCVVDLAASATS
jgi:hypothetical protein